MQYVKSGFNNNYQFLKKLKSTNTIIFFITNHYNIYFLRACSHCTRKKCPLQPQFCTERVGSVDLRKVQHTVSCAATTLHCSVPVKVYKILLVTNNAIGLH